MGTTLYWNVQATAAVAATKGDLLLCHSSGVESESYDDYETVDLLRTQAVATSHATCTISQNTGINIILLPVPFHATGGL